RRGLALREADDALEKSMDNNTDAAAIDVGVIDPAVIDPALIDPTLIDPALESVRPYVGAVPFQRSDEQKFFGREREADELASLVVAHPVVLLYAQSGVGKTSLINARLIPVLEKEEECQVSPPARVAGTLPPGIDPQAMRNPSMFYALDRWSDGRLSR